jgi:arylsulfatase A-like enzyme
MIQGFHMPRPNIICFVTDQHHANHLSCAGNPDVKTPNLDRLAADGLLFTKSYVANPVCSPNRACMFTGQYPKSHGLRENGNSLVPGSLTLPGVLADNGYQTFSSGKLHLAPFGMQADRDVPGYEKAESNEYWNREGSNPMVLPYHGLQDVFFVGGHGHYNFGHHKRELQQKHPGVWEGYTREGAREQCAVPEEVWCAGLNQEYHYNTAIADKTIEFLKARHEEQPFFIWCSFPDPHHPFSPPAPWFDMYDADTIHFDPIPDEGNEGFPEKLASYRSKAKANPDAIRDVIAKNYGMISMVDHNIGRVIEELEEQNLVDNTIIVFFADHGDYMGDHGLLRKALMPYDAEWRVPTIWRIPGQKRTGTTTAMHSTVDLMPTLLDLAGLEIPGEVQGVSQKSVLDGESESARQVAYAEFDTTGSYERVRFIRTDGWMLAYFFGCEFGMMYNMENAPLQQNNVFEHPDYRAKRDELMMTLLKETAAADPWKPEKRCHA